MRYITRGHWQPGLMVEQPGRHTARNARLTALLLMLGYSLHRVNKQLDACELVGHDAHWTSPTVRACTRCPMTWRRDVGDIAATTTNQPDGW